MVKVLGALFSMPAGLPVRKPRKIYPLVPPTETILVTSGVDPPIPNCTGTYEYFQMFMGFKAYRRLPNHDFFLFGESFHLIWYISDVLGDYELYSWNHEYGMIGIYDPANDETFGNPVIS